MANDNCVFFFGFFFMFDGKIRYVLTDDGLNFGCLTVDPDAYRDRPLQTSPYVNDHWSAVVSSVIIKICFRFY